MRQLLLPLLLAAAFGIAACSGTSDGERVPAPEPGATLSSDPGLVGKPQNRAGIGDVQRVFERYESSRGDLIELYKAQPWYQDGLTRDEELFIERGISFVARYDGPKNAQVERASIEAKLYKYDRLKLSKGEIELLLIYRPGDRADYEMTVMKQVIPVLESLVGVEFPERVLTVVNGDFEINDFNDGQFIRIASCCTSAPSILAHELAHTYWSMAPSWFNEGMADLYANFALERLNAEPPAGWQRVPADLDSYYRSRKAAVESGRFPNIVLPRRFASDGLYEAADAFLLDIRIEIGAQSFAAAARDVYLASDFGRYVLREKRIEDIFLEHTTSEDRDAVMTLFNKHIWGDNGERYRDLRELEGS